MVSNFVPESDHPLAKNPTVKDPVVTLSSTDLTRVDSAPSRINLSVLPKSLVVSVSGQGVASSAGKLYIWNAQKNSWVATSTQNIAGIKLGANNDEIWAMDANKQLARVQPDGTLEADSATSLPAEVTDFAVYPTGSKAFIAGGALSVLPRGAGAAEPLHPPAEMGPAKSLAITNDGHLYVLTQTGELWAMSRNASENPESESTENWKRLNDAPNSGDAAVSSMGPALNHLQVLRDGSLGAEANGRLYKREGLAWAPTTPNAKSARELFYDRFPTPSGGWNKVFLNNVRTPGFFSFGLPNSSPSTAGHNDFAAMKQQLSKDMGCLSQFAVASMGQNRSRLAEIAPGASNSDALALRAMIEVVDGNADRALETLESNSGQLPRSNDSKIRNSANHNTLQAVLNFRRRILGRPIDNPINTRIRDLLRDGVHLPIGDKKFMVPIGKLVHDHAVLMRAIGGSPDDLENSRRRIDGVVAGDRDANIVTTLFNSAIVDGTLFERTNAASSRINSGIQNLNAEFVRTIREMEDPSPRAIAERAVQFLNSLKPNKEKISLTFHNSNGFDLEGLWAFFNLNAETVGLSGGPFIALNKDPILTPLATGELSTAIGMEMSRTTNGLRISINDSTEAGASAGLRFQWRFGAVSPQANNTVSLIAVTGAEAAPIVGGAAGQNRSITLDFEQDDNGKVQDIVRDLYSGAASLESLIKRADAVTNSQGNTYKLKGEAYAHGFVALRSIYGKERDDIQNGLFLGATNLIVPALDQLSASKELSWSDTTAASTDGSVTKSRNFSSQGRLDFNHIAVFDVSTWISAVINPSAQSSAQLQWKVPFYLGIWNKSLWSDKVIPAGAHMHFNPEGRLTGASIGFSTAAAPMRTSRANQPMTVENFPQLSTLLAAQPDLQQFLDVLNENPALVPSVTMELTPRATAALHESVGALPDALTNEERREAITRLAATALNNPNNLRITGINVAQGKSDADLVIKAFGPLRQVHGRNHTLNGEGASIAMVYDESGACSEFNVRGEPLLGAAVNPNIEQFTQLSKYSAEALDHILSPVANHHAKHVLATSLASGSRVDRASITRYQQEIFAPNTDGATAIEPGDLAMRNGQLVYRPTSAGLGQVVNVPLDIQQQIVERNPQGLLSLMSAYASGVVNTRLTEDQVAAMENLPIREQSATRPLVVPVDVSPASALHINDIIEAYRNTGEQFDQFLSPAQRLVLATFMPAERNEESSSAAAREPLLYSQDLLRQLTLDPVLASNFTVNVNSAPRLQMPAA